MPLISVIVPCYNQAQYLDECLQSVLDQTYQDWECIIVNDGSPDNTEEIAKKWLERDQRFRYVWKENGGLSSARNAGLQLAKGEIIQLLDCDDFISKYKFELQLLDLINNDYSICNYVKVSKERQILSDNYCTPFSTDNFNYEELILNWETKLSIPCHCVLFRKNNVFFVEQLLNHEDWVFWLQSFYLGQKVVYNRNVLCFYRIAENSMSRNKEVMQKGFLGACDFMIQYFRKTNNRKYRKLMLEKKNEINGNPKLTNKENFAKKFPQIYNFYIKNVK